MDTKDLCFIDIETTGNWFGYHEIIEVAAIRTSPDAGNIKQTWHKRIRPRHPDRITKEAQDLNKFTLEEWADEPHRSSDLEGVSSLCRGLCRCMPQPIL